MKILFESNIDIAEAMFDDYINDDDEVSLVAGFDIVSDVLNWLFNIDDGNLTIKSIELGDGEIDGYEGPYLLCIAKNGELWCQKAYSDSGKMVYTEDDIIYVEKKYYKEVMDTCFNDEAEIYEISFDDETEEAESCDKSFKLIMDQNDKPCGFDFSDEGENYCFSIHYCQCIPDGIDHIVKLYKALSDEYTKFI